MGEESQFVELYGERIMTYRPSTGALAEEQEAAHKALQEPVESDYEAMERLGRWNDTFLPRDPTIGQDPSEESFMRDILTERGHEMFRRVLEDDDLLRAFFEDYAATDIEVSAAPGCFIDALIMCGKREKLLFLEFVSRLNDLNIEGLEMGRIGIKKIDHPFFLSMIVNRYKEERDGGIGPSGPAP